MDFMDDGTNDKYLWNHSQHIDDGIVEEDQILKTLEEIIEEVIFGALHYEIVVMSIPQSILSHYEPDVFLRKDSLSNHGLCGLSIYDFDEVCSLSMNLTQVVHFLHFDFWD